MSIRAINRLRAIYVRLPKGLARNWFAACLAEYESGAKHGVTLGDAFGLRLRPGAIGWWALEAQARRDEILRDIGGEHFQGISVRSTAREILREAIRYQTTAWRQDRAFKSPPATLAGTRRAKIFALLKTGAPLSETTIRRALAHETTLSVGHSAGHDEAELHKEPNASSEIETATRSRRSRN